MEEMFPSDMQDQNSITFFEKQSEVGSFNE